MSDQLLAEEVQCPVCSKDFTSSEIEEHVNRCLFLNSFDGRAASTSPGSASSSSAKKNKRQSTCEILDSPSNISIKRSRIPDVDDVSSYTTTSISLVTQNPEPAASHHGVAASASVDKAKPLAEQVRPRELDTFIGQEKVLGPNTLLRRLLEKGDITSMILWGPPGCGKTTLAHVIANKCRSGKIAARFVKLSAVSSGVADVKEVVKVARNELASFKRRTVLFMDEIHRFNKLQQDIFLPHVESGSIILIGATTENPSFSLNSALLSRCRVLVLEKLSAEHILNILKCALQQLGATTVEDSSQNEGYDLLIEAEALQWLADVCDGDARIALNSLQLAFQTRKEISSSGCSQCVVTLEDIKEGIKRSHLLYDRAGDEHYNLISAMHKSIRASDENAALYWTARMIQGGEDPRFLARRLVRAASEDIGLADPAALTLAVTTMQGCQLLGMPESDVLLAQCAVYLARAPKSREINNALARAKHHISQHQGPLPEVPLHLRNAPTRLMEQLGYGQGYSVDPSEVPEMTYMPEGLENIDFFG